ncbi:hypothetical protein PG994_008970 [Apiospora phragmitis]|uniref:DUF1996 domain-containing protein n=1 Tax=Apiospora phragmitis TaxID=2905665 RepID=A0ABR1UIJ8_9PEZI
MKRLLVSSIAALATLSNALVRFQCSQLVIERLDPLVNPGMVPSAHVHQIVGGNSFNATMDPKKDMPGESTCTTCSFAEDFSNYWTAVLYFKARNGTYKRVPQTSQIQGAQGGITVYYMQDALYDQQQKSKVTAFKPVRRPHTLQSPPFFFFFFLLFILLLILLLPFPSRQRTGKRTNGLKPKLPTQGFRMFTGNVAARTKAEMAQFRQLTYTCMDNTGTREPETLELPARPCAAGIMVNARFPTCWDGVNLDAPDHMAHMAYPASGTFESGGPCPASHPMRMPQVLFEVVWDTRQFNNKADWPADESQPFVWSFGDGTGYGNHADYVFGWKGDALQRLMDDACVVNCPNAHATTQSTAAMNRCAKQKTVTEDIDGWLMSLPGM